MAALREKTFEGWPNEVDPVELKALPLGKESRTSPTRYEFLSQPHVPLPMVMTGRASADTATSVVLHVLDDEAWSAAAPPFESATKPAGDANQLTFYLAPRGVGPTALTRDEKKRTQILRRYPLLGQTLEGMQVWDVRRAVQAIRSLPTTGGKPLTIRAGGRLAGVALYASLFEPPVERLELRDLPRSHVDGPHLLNVLKTLDLPAAVAMAAERTHVVITQSEQGGWDYPKAVTGKLGWGGDRVRISGGATPE
jgi:hypothetical protein